MTPFDRVTGIAAPLMAPNIDTDVIMPKMFLKGVDRSGLGEGAFNLLRLSAGKPNPDFILNREGYHDACFLVVGPNFGCGSSREHAVWGLQQLAVVVSDPGCNDLTIDLTQQSIRFDRGARTIAFDVDQAKKEAFLTGRDLIGSALAFAADIRAFEARHCAANPWMF